VIAYHKKLKKAQADMERLNQPERMAQLQTEIAIVDEFMPKQLDDAALDALVDTTIASLPGVTVKVIGKVVWAGDEGGSGGGRCRLSQGGRWVEIEVTWCALCVPEVGPLKRARGCDVGREHESRREPRGIAREHGGEETQARAVEHGAGVAVQRFVSYVVGVAGDAVADIRCEDRQPVHDSADDAGVLPVEVRDGGF